MKKMFLLAISGLFIVACSVENEDVLPQDGINSLNSLFTNTNDADPCGTMMTHDFQDYGEIVVMNDDQNLYITVRADAGSSILNSKLHIADGSGNFPTRGQGNLPPGQMEFNENFEVDRESHTFTFDLSSYDGFGDEDGDGLPEIAIASFTTFATGDTTNEIWAGDIYGKQGNWYHFVYEIQECTVIETSCTYGFGYWKNHGPETNGNQQNEWPVNELILGDISYGEEGLLEILNTPVRGDEIISLMHHLIAAKLNVANGADDSEVIEDIETADAILAGEVEMSKDEINDVKAALEAWNEGAQNCESDYNDPCDFLEDEYVRKYDEAELLSLIENEIMNLPNIWLDLLDPEVYSTNGTFVDGEIVDIFNAYRVEQNKGVNPIPVTYYYTVTRGECTDTTALTLLVSW